MKKIYDAVDRFCARHPRFGIPDLMRWIVIGNVAVYVLMLLTMRTDANAVSFLYLNGSKVLHGELWRIVTFIFVPTSSSPLRLALSLYLYYWIGSSLERQWGTARFNLYYWSCVLLTAIVTIVASAISGTGYAVGGTGYVNLSMFLAFAFLYPDTQLLLFYFIPVKIKWLAWLDGAYFIWAVIQAFLPAYGGSAYGIYYKANALAAVVSILNFLIFFLNSRNVRPYRPSQVKRKNDFHRQVHKARPVNYYKDGARHRCAVCGRTELDDPKLEFRYCSKCNGNYEYCQEHLFTHKHVI